MKRTFLGVLSWIAFAALVACGGGGGGQQNKPVVDTSPDQTFRQSPGATRTWLTAADLNSGRTTPDAPLHNGYFMPVGTATAALTPFSGTIRLSSFRLYTDDTAPDAHAVDATFPNIDLRFVSDGDDLIPLDRDILAATNTDNSRLILGPGKVWSEPGDGGGSRASLPFEIVNPIWNLTRNGLATFVYTGSQISSVRVQLVQESNAEQTASNIWGTLTATFLPQNFGDGAATVAAFHQEKAAYLPIQPWENISSKLAHDTAYFNGGADTYMSFTGLVKDGVIYLQPCRSRSGDYPYCAQMRAGAFSVTKSMGAAVALLRLAQKYGDDVGTLLIKDYVNVTATHHGWDNVTFLNALNMTTGIGINFPNQPVGTGCCMFADENTDFMMRAFAARGGKDAILAAAFQQNAFSWGPGVEVRYDALHTFILSAAMDAFLKTKEGPNAHLWDMVTDEVYKPIGIAHAPMMHTVEKDGSRGIPYLDVGLYPTADDTAKIAQLFQDGGQHGGVQLLSAGLTAIALYRTANQGLIGASGYNNRYGNHRYLMSFHSVPWNDGASCQARVPSMQGAGGQLVVLLPNGVTAFRYAHANIYDTTPMIETAASLGPMCAP